MDEYEVGFEVWFKVEADSEGEAFAKAFDRANTTLSNLVTDGDPDVAGIERIGDWEIAEVEKV